MNPPSGQSSLTQTVLTPTVTMSVLGLNTILVVVSLGLYLERRELFPIANRLPKLAACEIIAAYIASVMMCLASSFRTSPFANCTVITSTLIFCDMTINVCISGRVGWLLLKDLYTQELLKRKSNSSAVRPGSFQEKMFQIVLLGIEKSGSTQKSLTLYCSLFFVYGFSAIISLLVSFESNNSFWYQQECFAPEIRSIAIASPAWIHHFIGGTLFAVRLLRLQDNFNFATEVRMLLGIVVLIISSIAFLYFLAQPLGLSLSFSPEMFGILCVVVIIPVFVFAQCVYHVWLSFRQHERHTKKKFKADKDKLMGTQKQLLMKSTSSLNYELLKLTIANPAARKLFLEFLEAELAVENLFFYEECDVYKRMVKEGASQQELLKLVNSIRGTYILNSAPHCVNISFETRKDVLENLASNNLNEELFDKAQSQVFRLMARDTFLRFQISKSFLEMEFL
jgi:hypothetical protein